MKGEGEKTAQNSGLDLQFFARAGVISLITAVGLIVPGCK